MGYRKCTLWNLAYIFVSDDIEGRYSRDDKLRASIWLLVKLLCVPIIRGPCPKHHEGLFLKTTRTCVCLYLFVQLVSGAALTAGLVYLTHVQARAMRSIQNTQTAMPPATAANGRWRRVRRSKLPASHDLRACVRWSDAVPDITKISASARHQSSDFGAANCIAVGQCSRPNNNPRTPTGCIQSPKVCEHEYRLSVGVTTVNGDCAGL